MVVQNTRWNDRPPRVIDLNPKRVSLRVWCFLGGVSALTEGGVNGVTWLTACWSKIRRGVTAVSERVGFSDPRYGFTDDVRGQGADAATWLRPVMGRTTGAVYTGV